MFSGQLLAKNVGKEFARLEIYSAAIIAGVGLGLSVSSPLPRDLRGGLAAITIVWLVVLGVIILMTNSSAEARSKRAGHAIFAFVAAALVVAGGELAWRVLGVKWIIETGSAFVALYGSTILAAALLLRRHLSDEQGYSAILFGLFSVISSFINLLRF